MVPRDDPARREFRRDSAPASANPAKPLLSEFAGDEDMAELIAFFIEDLQQRIETISRAWTEGDQEQVRHIAHQLKGAASGYGYPSITAAAGALEHLLMEEEAEVVSVAEKVEDLLALCRRAGTSAP